MWRSFECSEWVNEWERKRGRKIFIESISWVGKKCHPLCWNIYVQSWKLLKKEGEILAEQNRKNKFLLCVSVWKKDCHNSITLDEKFHFSVEPATTKKKVKNFAKVLLKQPKKERKTIETIFFYGFFHSIKRAFKTISIRIAKKMLWRNNLFHSPQKNFFIFWQTFF
jgi:hypothetical protein